MIIHCDIKKARPLFVEGGQMGSAAVRLYVLSNVFETTKKDQNHFLSKKTSTTHMSGKSMYLTLSVRAQSKKVTNEEAVSNRTRTFVSENGYGYPTPGNTDTPTQKKSCINV